MQTSPGWFWLGNAMQATRVPGSWHTPTTRPACDTVTAEPGQVTAGPAVAETAASLLT
jgi:hypothetical protein